MTHAPGRDVPPERRNRKLGLDSPKRSAARVARGDGTSWPRRGVETPEEGRSVAKMETRPVQREARRPPFCLLFDDLDDEPARGVFGMYPTAFIGKILPWLQCDRSRILHVCSGGLPKGEGIRVDIRPEAKPDIVADGRKLPIADGSVDAVLIDPPYTEAYAKTLYGTSYPRPAHLLREAARVVRHGGRVAMVHYLVPNPALGTFFVRCFGLSMGFGYPMRAVTLYERHQASLFGEEHPLTSRQARRRRKAEP